MVGDYGRLGWVRFGHDPAVARWAEHARVAALAAVADPKNAQWLDGEGTWFVGVDALDNDPEGGVAGSGPLTGDAVDFIRSHIGPLPALHRAQVSVIYPGYPRPRAGEGEAAFRYRARRDAAHVDGLLASGPDRRRRVQEPHGFILGLPLNEAAPGAAPLVVWEGSHHIMRAAFTAALSGHSPQDMATVDVTEAYQDARRKVFQTCARIELPARPGEAYLLHRMALHGVAPWSAEAGDDREGRMIAYFRPEIVGGVAAWLGAN